MVFRYRKSINLGGGFKINISKSGIGYSWGVPGYRITKTARRNTKKTYSIPGTGLSYVDETGHKRTKTTPASQPSPVNLNPVMHDMDSAPIEELKAAEYNEFVEQLQRILTINKVSNVFL